MKSIFRIFKTDMKNIGTNWVAAVLIGGLIILPSLYAWFNIKASWDPYGQTDQIPIGVVNEDEGATIQDKDIDVGHDLVDELKDNKSMEWHFDNRKKAMDKVKYGDYFAVIVIPKDFSKRLGTVLDEKPEKADVEYYVNEKLNAIAPKITSKGAGVIVDQVNSKFVSTVNGVIFDAFNQIGLELQENLPDIKKFEDYILTLDDKLPEVHKVLKESQTDAHDASDIIKKAQKTMPKAKDAVKNGQDTIKQTNDYLNKAQNRLDKMAPEIESDLQKVQKIVAQVDKTVHEIDTSKIDFSDGKAVLKQLRGRTDKAIERIDAIEGLIKQLQKQNDEMSDHKDETSDQKDESKDEMSDQKDEPKDEPKDESEDEIANQKDKLDDALERLETLKAGIKEAQGNSDKVQDFLDDKKSETDKTISDLQDITKSTHTNVDGFVKEYKNTIEPTVRQEVANAKKTLSEAGDVLNDIQSTIPKVDKILNRTGDNLGKGQKALDDVLSQYPYVHDKVSNLADRIRDVQDKTDVSDIIELLLNDPKAEESFFANPVQLNENKLFPIPTYGAGMTPFYTVLAIWVGALLLISLLAVDVKNAEELTVRQVYFGKLSTFITIGIMQTLIVTLGDMYLINSYVSEPVWFVLFGICTSLLFMSIVYTLVSVFGDVGKALAIVFLVLQIAGSGGTYPVVLLPKFFQTINPFLPFTYATDLMREAVGGIVWERAIHDLVFMALFAILFLLIGTFLKKALNKQTKKLMKKSHETGLFH